MKALELPRDGDAAARLQLCSWRSSRFSGTAGEANGPEDGMGSTAISTSAKRWSTWMRPVSPGRRAGSCGHGHRLSSMDPVPVALRRRHHAVRLEQLLQADVGQTDLRSEIAHRGGPGKILQVLGKDENLGPGVRVVQVSPPKAALSSCESVLPPLPFLTSGRACTDRLGDIGIFVAYAALGNEPGACNE